MLLRFMIASMFLLFAGCASVDQVRGVKYRVIETKGGEARKCEVEKVEDKEQCIEGQAIKTYTQFTSWALDQKSKEEGFDFYFRAPTEPKSPYYFNKRGKTLRFHHVHLNPNVRIGDCEVTHDRTEYVETFEHRIYNEVCTDHMGKSTRKVKTTVKSKGNFAEILSVEPL